jgi:hypothetical protein
MPNSKGSNTGKGTPTVLPRPDFKFSGVVGRTYLESDSGQFPEPVTAPNCFHTTALCSPTRAALITGRNHHSAAFAGITELATGCDGYTCILPRSCGTVGEVLRQNGYMTA